MMWREVKRQQHSISIHTAYSIHDTYRQIRNVGKKRLKEISTKSKIKWYKPVFVYTDLKRWYTTAIYGAFSLFFLSSLHLMLYTIANTHTRASERERDTPARYCSTSTISHYLYSTSIWSKANEREPDKEWKSARDHCHTITFSKCISVYDFYLFCRQYVGFNGGIYPFNVESLEFYLSPCLFRFSHLAKTIL